MVCASGVTAVKETYKVFFSLKIDKTLDPKNDVAVATLDMHEERFKGETPVQDPGIKVPLNSLSTPASISKSVSHEIGHQGGLSDYYKVTTDNPYTPVGVSVVSSKGFHLEYTVGELMDVKKNFNVLSQVSVDRMVSPAIAVANTVKENKVTLLSGRGIQKMNPSTKKLESHIESPKILKKE